ncbi:MAG TPA: copper homeostasis protein CutC [Ruminococcaceae bacterium]|nr:copper homeostasis protein CutC [Oscillospiraceae bacterium]
MTKLTVEVCCGSADDVIEAQKAGADRVELNSNLSLGGITPSLGELKEAKAKTRLPVMAMVRPRESGFYYTHAEFRTALLDAEALLTNGADGIVFGFLNADGTVDTGRCREILRLADGRETVFHRAVDVVPDWKAAVDQLCELGVTRILTSGQRASVFDGAPTVAEMICYARGRIQILPGGGVRRHNVQEIIAKTGCTQIHISPHKICLDPSASGNPEIHFGAADAGEDRYRMVDADEVRKIRELICSD